MERSSLENTSVDGRIKLELILDDLDGKEVIGFIWLKIRISDGIL
jgi:hypothetical protein